MEMHSFFARKRPCVISYSREFNYTVLLTHSLCYHHPMHITIDIFIYAAIHSWSCVFILCVCASFLMVRLYVNCGRPLFLFSDGL